MPETPPIDTAPIREYIAETFLFGDASDLDDNTSFMETGLIDSLGILKVANFIERTYDLKLQPEQFVPENLDSVENIARFISRNIVRESIGAATSA